MNRWFRYLIVFLVCLAVLVVVLVVYVQIRNKHQADRVHDVAEQLGYGPQGHLAQVRRCWDIFSHCGQFLYFTTDSPLDEFQARVDQLGFTQTRLDPVDGHAIFTAINLGTRRRLTANGDDGLAERSAAVKPDAHEWHLVDQKGQEWVVGYFETTDPGVQYAIDGQGLRGRIVSIMLRTK